MRFVRRKRVMIPAIRGRLSTCRCRRRIRLLHVYGFRQRFRKGWDRREPNNHTGRCWVRQPDPVQYLQRRPVLRL